MPAQIYGGEESQRGDGFRDQSALRKFPPYKSRNFKGVLIRRHPAVPSFSLRWRPLSIASAVAARTFIDPVLRSKRVIVPKGVIGGQALMFLLSNHDSFSLGAPFGSNRFKFTTPAQCRSHRQSVMPSLPRWQGLFDMANRGAASCGRPSGAVERRRAKIIAEE